MMNRFKLWVFDCDGVLWVGEHLLPRVKETLHTIQHVWGRRVVFVTNNATKSRAENLAKFHRLGLSDITIDQVYGSAFAAAEYFRQNKPIPTTKSVYVIGEKGLHHELQSVGLKTYGLEDNTKTYSIDEAAHWPTTLIPERNIGAVVVGLDTKVNMFKLAFAAQCIRQGSIFIATNKDPQLPVQGDVQLPGAGSLVAAITIASGSPPAVVCGKPEPTVMHLLLKTFDLRPEEAIMVGDRLSTDVAFGKAAGCSTILVLTGSEKVEDIDRLGIKPDYVLPAMCDILNTGQ
eukprot:PhF_6_TR33849/c0_g1_i1/m.49646/K19269/PGP, PGLP; phosphoglycolate phosphatase